MIDIKKVLVDKINKAKWWHVVPQDPDAYRMRGKFLASSYQQSEFYGRPNDIPEKVFVVNPLHGFSEQEILARLFPSRDNKKLLDTLYCEGCYRDRIMLDAEMFEKAKDLGYDAIVLMTETGRKDLERNRKPRSIELNLLNF